MDVYGGPELRGPVLNEGYGRNGGGGNVGYGVMNGGVGGGYGVMNGSGYGTSRGIGSGGGGGAVMNGGVNNGLTPRTGRPCGASNKFYSEPMDCSVFYICTHGKLVRFLCPGGSVWNQRKSVCDWECDNLD